MQPSPSPLLPLLEIDFSQPCPKSTRGLTSVTSNVASSLIMFAAFSPTISAVLLLYVSRSHLDMGHMGRSSHFHTTTILLDSPPNRKNDPYSTYAPMSADIAQRRVQQGHTHKPSEEDSSRLSRIPAYLHFNLSMMCNCFRLCSAPLIIARS